MLADIEAAQSDVHIIIFGFKAGEIGSRFRDLLIKKVGEGIPVRLMVEGFYSQPGLGSRALYRELREGGVQIVANQGGFLDLDGLLGERKIDWRFDDFGHFDHRKIVVVDGRVAFVGGPGIEDHYNDDRFHDIMLRLEGPIVSQLQAVFLLSWHFQGGPLPETAAELDRYFPVQPDGPGVEMEILLNNPGEKHLPIAPAFQAAIDGATRRLYVINPYLADRAILKGIVEAGRRGVDVRVIVPADPQVVPGQGRRPCVLPGAPGSRRGHSRAPEHGPRQGRPRRRHGLRGDRQSRRAEPAPQLGAPAPDRRPRGGRSRREGAVRSGSPHRHAGADPNRPPRTGREPGGVGDLAAVVGLARRWPLVLCGQILRSEHLASELFVDGQMFIRGHLGHIQRPAVR